MNYNFTNKTDAELEAIIAAAMAERRARIIANISSYPVPAITGSVSADVIAYRNAFDVPMTTANYIVRHYYDNPGLSNA